jgi:hypothetical protein
MGSFTAEPSSRLAVEGPEKASHASSRRPAGMRGLLRGVPAWAIVAVFGIAYVIAAPPSADLAAATYRSDLFSQVGFTLWDNGWYGGHYLPAYSILAPVLGALIGSQLLAALAMIAATALFALLIDGLFPAQATRIAAVWFAVGASVALLANRVPFDLGLALGLGCLLAARLERRLPALLLAALSSLASPIAGAFLALVLIAWALAGRPPAASRNRSRRGLIGWPVPLAVAALAPIALLWLLFPEGGIQPFVASAFYPALACVLLLCALIARNLGQAGSASGSRGARVERALLGGALLYALALALAYVIPSAMGGNADRLGALLAGPLAACVLLPRHPRVLLTLAPFLLYWQVNAPLADFASAASDPAVHASYYAPLLRELDQLHLGYSERPARIEVVATADHWEARFLAPYVAIARGWERQLDDQRNAVFYEETTPLTAAGYRAWLSEQAISYVALPDAPLDYSATAEARLVRGASAAGRPPAYLREVWRSAHWRLFAVLGARPLAQPPAALTRLGSDSFTLAAPHAGTFTVRVHFTPYWAIALGNGCVRRAPGDWTELQARTAGSFHVVIDFSLARVLDRGPRCS